MVRRIEDVDSRINQVTKSIQNSTDVSFRYVLESKLKTGEINISKHAQERILLRKIEISQEEINRINKAIDLANSKGVRDSLVIINGKAFVINVPTRTVVTAIEEESLKDRIFTNIDGAVIL